jgi:CheY-like chemotaxis protein
MRMSDVSLRLLAVFAAEANAELLRQGAAHAAPAAQFSHAATAAAARAALTASAVDVVLVDSMLAERDMKEIFKIVRAAPDPPVIILVAPSSEDAADLAAAGVTDLLVARPAKPADAKALIESCTRLKVPSRVLVVDDASTMRSIVRKILDGCRFPFEISEADDAFDALKLIAAGEFDLILLDYNMPGLNGFEILPQLKDQHPRLEIVMMSSVQDDALAARARAAGAAGFLKKPFYATDIDAILYEVYHLRPSAA